MDVSVLVAVDLTMFQPFFHQVLYFTVMMVYAVISPLVCFVMALCFYMLMAVFRHQFVYIYASTPDSGGRLWLKFTGVYITCILIGEITSMSISV